MGEGQTPETTHGVHHSAHDPTRGIPEVLARAALNQVLQSQGFRASRRSQDFLRYVVERTLEGQADALKERTIGIDVFGRSTSYEPSDDATVRVKAGEVRKRLGLYYAGQGATDPVRIELPAGTYIPEFRWVEVPGAAPPQEPAPAAMLQQSLRDHRFKWIAAGVVVLLAIAAIGWWLARGRSSATALDQFWSPVLN